MNFIEHIENTHRDEKDLLLTPELLAAREFTLKRPERPCPLCGKEIDDNATMQSHIAVHLETVALFTLPNIDEDQDESQEANSVSNMANQKFAESRAGDFDSSVDLIFSDFGDDENSQLPSVTGRELSAEEVNRLKETSQENISDDVGRWIRNCAYDEKYLGEDPDPLDNEADLARSTANEAPDEDNAEPVPSADLDYRRHDSSTKNTAKEASTDSGEEIIRKAVDEIRIKVSADDAENFQLTSLHDVWVCARHIEQEQIERARLQNMRRIEPILRSLESYASVIDTFCQGFSPMAWVWVCAFLEGLETQD